MNAKQKVVVILGPTASGKSDLAVLLAKKFNGEIISADSRQVYKGLNIGTGKITRREMQGVPHHLLDVADPKKRFTVSKYQILVHKKIQEITARGKLPIICGGTGFYIQAIVDNVILPDVSPNLLLRGKLLKLKAETLYKKLQKLDPKRAAAIDPKNKIRVVRAIEIAQSLGRVPEIKTEPLYDALQIGIKIDMNDLREKIQNRLLKRIKNGMIIEAKTLHENGLTYKRMMELGLEYRYLALYLLEKISKDEMLTRLQFDIGNYAKRQMQWFTKDTRIKWYPLNQKNKIETAIKKFLVS